LNRFASGPTPNSETHHQIESIVHGSQLIGFEAPGGPPQALWVDNRRLLDEDPGLGVIQ
jgi:hypothetical protein